jgi:hypothetical protein
MRSDGRVDTPPRASRVASPVIIVFAMMVCVLSGLLTGSAYAGESGIGNDGIVIEADTTEYRVEPEGTVVVAQGNAKVCYDDFFASADYICVRVGPGDLVARGNVVAHQATRTIKCELLTHNFYTGKGHILAPDAHISDLYLRGSEMNLEPGVLTLNNAYVTGCELDYPCYRVSTKRIVIYPDDRVVAEWPILWFGNVPVMILPRLTLPLEGDGIAYGEGKGIPIPNFSYDSFNGYLMGLTYIDNTHDWGTLRYEGGYLSRRNGIKLRGEAELALGPGKTGILEGGYTSWEGFSAAARYGMSLSNSLTLEANVRYVPVNSGGNSTRWKGFVPGDVEGKLLVQTSRQGPINAKATIAKDIRSTGDVYRIPELEVSLKPVSIPGNIGSITLSGGVGRFREPSRLMEAGRSHVVVSYASPAIRLSSGITGNLSLGTRRAWYETGDRLDSSSAGARVRMDFGKAEAFSGIVPKAKVGLSYDFTQVQGSSPFAFDKISPVNKASANVDYRVSKDWSIGLSTSYNFADESIQDVGVLLTHHNHCYDIQASWHKKQQVFGIEMKFVR